MKYLTNSLKLILLGLLGQMLFGCDQTAQIEPDSTTSDSLVVELIATDSMTPLQLLLEHHEVEYRSSIMGAFVTSVDSVENSVSAFWIYTVNDTTPKVACDKMSLNAGDRLKWHFRRVLSKPDEDSSSSE